MRLDWTINLGTVISVVPVMVAWGMLAVNAAKKAGELKAVHEAAFSEMRCDLAEIKADGKETKAEVRDLRDRVIKVESKVEMLASKAK